MKSSALPARLSRGSALALALLLAPAAVQATPIGEATAVVERWAEDFNAGAVDKLVSAYAPDATVHVTTGANLLSGPDRLRASFAAAARAGMKVRMGPNVAATALSPDAVILAGFYEFARAYPDGQAHGTPARYSFVLSKRNGRWLIAHQHSSVRTTGPVRPTTTDSPDHTLRKATVTGPRQAG